MSPILRRFEGAIDDPGLHAAFNAFDNVMLAEEDPTLGTRPLGDTAAMLANAQADRDRFRWFLIEGEAIIGAALLDNDTEDTENLHLGWFQGGVLPEWRRAGHGTRIMAAVAQTAVDEGRSLLMGETNSEVPAGGAFLEALDFEAGLVEEISQVLMADIDPTLMNQWVEGGRAQSERFDLFWLEGPWPEDMRPDVVRLTHVMNDAPVGDLDFHDMAFTEQHLTAEEAEIFARDITRITAAVRDVASGRLVGFTQLFINPSFPDLGQQGDTGVLPEFRGNGLGKWIKAEVARHLMSERPEITRIRTGNASSNAAMLGINHAMGFTLHHANTIWQAPSAEVVARLA